MTPQIRKHLGFFAIGATLLAGVACGGGDGGEKAQAVRAVADVTTTTAAEATTTTIPAEPTTTTTACGVDRIATQMAINEARTSLAGNRAEYDYLKGQGNHDAQLVANLEYLLAQADRAVDRARTAVTEAEAAVAAARTWEDYEYAMQQHTTVNENLADAVARQKKASDDIARAKANPTFAPRLSSLTRLISEDKARIGAAEAELARCN